MPSRRFHEKIDRFFLGKSFPHIHKALDLPHIILGERHRILFHDPISAVAIGFILGGQQGAQSALLHTVVDRIFTDTFARKSRR